MEENTVMQNEAQEGESTIRLGELFAALWKNIVLLVVITAVILAAGLIYTFAIAEEEYASTATFSVVVSDDSKNDQPTNEFDLTNSQKLIGTVVGLIQGDKIYSMVVEEHPVVGTVDDLKDRVTVSSSDDSFIITVTAQHTNSQLSMYMANYVVDALIEYTNTSTDNLALVLRNAVTRISDAQLGSYAAPNKTLYAAVSLLGGLVIGCVVVFIKEFASNKFRTRKEVEDLLGDRVIGAFVDDKSKKGGPRKGIHIATRLVEPSVRNFEPYNNLLTNIRYSDLEHPYKVIMITSTGEGELKSTTLANLAACAAHNGKKALIIDLDLRKAIMHRVFGVKREGGIVEYLDGSKSKEEIVRHTESGVDLITAGTKVLNPVAVIEDSRLGPFIESLRGEYDYIFLDAPPVLVCSDAQAISKLCDGVIFNVSMRDVKKKDAREAVSGLKLVGAHIIGINVTKCDPKGGSSYYYHYYYSHGGYYSDGESHAAPLPQAQASEKAGAPKSEASKNASPKKGA